MKKINVTLLGALAVAGAILTNHPVMAQQQYPTRLIRIINPFLPGTSNDGIFRALSQRFSAAWGQPVVVENRAGAGGTIGADLVAKSAPDGYVLLATSASLAVNATLQPRLSFDPRRDLAPITQIYSVGLAIVVHPSVPARNLRELLALAKARRDGLNYGSNGTGTTSHLAGAWLQQLSRQKLEHIPYKGAGAAIPALIGGDVEIGFQTIGSMQHLIATNKLRGIAVTTLERSQLLPDLPTVASLYPGFEIGNWYGFLAPTGTPVAILNKIHAETVSSLQHPDIRSLLQGEFKVVGSAPAEFAAFLTSEISKYAIIIKASGAKPET